jgi:hypothetical protein
MGLPKFREEYGSGVLIVPHKRWHIEGSKTAVYCFSKNNAGFAFCFF